MREETTILLEKQCRTKTESLPPSAPDGYEVKLVSLNTTSQQHPPLCHVALATLLIFDPLPLEGGERRGSDGKDWLSRWESQSGTTMPQASDSRKPRRICEWRASPASDKRVVGAEFSPAGGLSLYRVLHHKTCPFPQLRYGLCL